MNKADKTCERPYTLTLSYNRDLCGDCRCATCYSQEFCDRCSSCKERSRFLERCFRYEGAFNY